MVLGALIGIGIGILVGIIAGNLLFSKREKLGDVSRLDVKCDTDDTVPMPDLDGKPVPDSNRKFLDYAPLWTKWPDHERVVWLNTILKQLWPYENYGVGSMVAQQAKAPIEDVIKKVPGGILQAIDIERLDLGTYPPQVTGMKVYHTKDDDAIMETNLEWGSDIRVRVGVRLKLGPFVIYVPLEVEDVQFRATARISLRPLVEELPCLGAAEVSLMEPPYVNLSLMLINRLDLMQLPIVKEAVSFIIYKVVADMVLYPNKFVVDLMPGKGLPPPPRGMLAVKIIKVEGITGGGDLLSKVDPYVAVNARKGRTARTRTVWNTKDPVFQETVSAVVDAPDEQTLHVELWEDNGGYRDVLLGELEIPIKGSAFFDNPGTPVEIKRSFSPPVVDEQMMINFAKMGAGAVTSGVGAVGSGISSVGKGLRDLVKKKKADAAAASAGSVTGEKKRKHLFSHKPHASTPHIGTAFMEVTYTPFKISTRQLLDMQKARDMRAAQAKSAAAAAVKTSEKLIETLEAELALREEGDAGNIPASDPKKKEQYYKITLSADSLRRRLDTACENLAEQREKLSECELVVKQLEDEKKAKAEEEKKHPKLKPAPTIEAPVDENMKGILTVTLIKGSSLRATGQVDPYVELSMYDPVNKRVEVQLSSTMENEPNPKWSEKFDFVNVSAISTLTLVVFDKKGLLESLLTFKGLTGRREPTENIGSVRIAVEEVARNKQLKDIYPLQDVQSGDLTLRLEWFPVEVTSGLTPRDARAAPALADGAHASLAGL